MSNMACLPEDQPDHLSNLNVNTTPSPPPAPLGTPGPPIGGHPPWGRGKETEGANPMSSTTAIYARVNPNLKKDKTSNNNFTSTFVPLLQVSIKDFSISVTSTNYIFSNPPFCSPFWRKDILKLFICNIY